MFRRSVPILIITLLSGFAFCYPAASASFRPPTPEEKKVLEHCSQVINKVLSQFQDEDWEENVDHTLANAEVNVNAGFPLSINAFVQRTYDVRGSSDRYKELVLPLVKQMVGAPNLEQKKDLNQQIQDLMHVQVQVRLNQPHVAVTPQPVDNEDLRIPGTAFAYRIKNDGYSSGTAYVLFFGDAKSLAWNPQHNWFDYKFGHAPNAAAVENLEFLIYGADDRIQHLLHAVDWNQVNSVFTDQEDGSSHAGEDPPNQP
ncbi:MAG TPA: hypothetical protein VN669_11850 [Candidatus Acidoferrales bacterium]|jgi:hypothetical protein|nr:hypothetical protein [Candidatus Acidoferrales bacterium]